VTKLKTIIVMTQQILQQIGLSEEQSLIYNALLERGYATARVLSEQSNVKRGMVYKTLEQLEALELVEKKDEPGSVSVFFPKHPSALKELLIEREHNLNAEKKALGEAMGQLTSQFNLVSGKPNVLFYEGKEGLGQVVEDSLYAKTEVYSYLDAENLEKYLHNVNKRYMKKREKLNVRKKLLMVDTPFARSFASVPPQSVTEVKLIKLNVANFATVMQIYDNKVSYLTLKPDTMIGAIIEDKHIYEMHKALFEHTWNLI